MTDKKPNEWTISLLSRFDAQLPIKTGMYTAQSLQNVDQNKQSLINVSKYRMNLVITELTKILQSVDSMHVYGKDAERNFCYSQLIILDTVEKYLNSNPSMNMIQRQSSHVVTSPLSISKDMILEDQEVAEILHDRNSSLNNGEILTIDRPISFSCDEEDDDDDVDYDYGNEISIPSHTPTS